MGIEADLLQLFSGSFGGVPGWVVFLIPLIVGIVIGYLIKQALIIGIVLFIVAIIASYLGFISLSSVLQEVKDLVTKYGPIASTYVAIFFGIIPLSIGLVIGLIIGFIA